MILQIGGEILFTARRIKDRPVYATFGAVSNVEEREGIAHFTFPFPDPPKGSVLPTAIQVHVIRGDQEFPTDLLLVARLQDCYGRESFPAPDLLNPGIYPSVFVVGVNTVSLTANSPDDVPCKAMALAFYPD